MSICPTCRHQVPTLNLAVHECICGRNRRHGILERSHPLTETNNPDQTSIATSVESQRIPLQDRPQQEIIVIDDSDDEIEEVHVSRPSLAIKQWDCPRCTLLNPIHVQRCDACDYSYSSSSNEISTSMDSSNYTSRPPDPTLVRHQLIESNNFIDRYNNLADPLSYMGGGALIGSLLGAAGAYMRGRNVTNSIMEGAMTGLLGGAIARDVLSSETNTTPSSAGRAFRQRTTTSTHRSNSTDPTNSPRLVSITRRRYPDGTVETICEENGVWVVQQNQRINENPSILIGDTNSFFMSQTPFLQSGSMVPADINHSGHIRPNIMMFHNNTTASVGNHLDAIDGMDYERLIELFGDGSDHMRGADEETMRRLPTTRLKNVEDELPNEREYRHCSICLEEFANGQTRKVLPCLHGFHESCIDRWLGANACCPICKHSLA